MPGNGRLIKLRLLSHEILSPVNLFVAMTCTGGWDLTAVCFQ